MKRLALVLLLAACDGSGSLLSGVDIALDAGGPDADPGADPGACPTPLGGDGAFGAHLTGGGPLSLSDGSTVTRVIQLDAYFPEGRTAGAPVILAGSVGWPWARLHVTQATLDADLGAEVSWHGYQGMEEVYLNGTLEPGAKGLVAHVESNTAEPGSDVIVMAAGTITLCPSGGVPAPTLTSAGYGSVFAPTAALRLVPSAPIAFTTVTLSASAGGASVPVTVDAAETEALLVVPTAAFPPGQAVELDVDAADILGRPFTTSLDFTPLATTAVVTDLAFDGAPPDGAVVGTETATADGLLELNASGSLGPYTALLALPERGAATDLRVTVGSWTGYAEGVHLAIVSATGARSDLPSIDLTVDTAPWDGAAPLPEGDPLYLVVEADTSPPMPQYLSLPSIRVFLDRIAFE
jgi:hypothetical protein